MVILTYIIVVVSVGVCHRWDDVLLNLAQTWEPKENGLYSTVFLYIALNHLSLLLQWPGRKRQKPLFVLQYTSYYQLYMEASEIEKWYIAYQITQFFMAFTLNTPSTMALTNGQKISVKQQWCYPD